MQISQLNLGTAATHEYNPQIKKLTVRGAATFPREILDYADEIEILDMSFSGLSALPDDFARLHKLKILFLSYTNLTEVPEVLETCDSLLMIGMRSCRIARFSGKVPANIEAITLTENQLTSLPASLGNLKHLKKLMLAGNRLRELPQELLGCSSLEGLRIAANDLAERPDRLLELPSLAWYSDAGNPFCAELAAERQGLSALSWRALSIGDKIGESAKNTVYKGRVTATGQAVAVKIYGGEVTTDGFPSDEIRVNVAAGTHPNIINGMAQLADAPDNQQGLVMPLIPPTFRPVGLPPDLHTHTRATYPAGQTFALPYIIAVLQGTSAALQHLHGRGIMHGDVYAHNLLADKNGRTYLGDFGGASFYNATSDRSREHVDVLGFGIMMEELLARCDSTTGERQKLDALRQDCMHPAPASRPSFADIQRQLRQL